MPPRTAAATDSFRAFPAFLGAVNGGEAVMVMRPALQRLNNHPRNACVGLRDCFGGGACTCGVARDPPGLADEDLKLHTTCLAACAVLAAQHAR